MANINSEWCGNFQLVNCMVVQASQSHLKTTQPNQWWMSGRSQEQLTHRKSDQRTFGTDSHMHELLVDSHSYRVVVKRATGVLLSNLDTSMKFIS